MMPSSDTIILKPTFATFVSWLYPFILISMIPLMYLEFGSMIQKYGTDHEPLTLVGIMVLGALIAGWIAWIVIEHTTLVSCDQQELRLRRLLFPKRVTMSSVKNIQWSYRSSTPMKTNQPFFRLHITYANHDGTVVNKTWMLGMAWTVGEVSRFVQAVRRRLRLPAEEDENTKTPGDAWMRKQAGI